MVWLWGLLALIGAALVISAPRLARASLQAQVSKRRLFTGHQGTLSLQLTVRAPLPVYVKLEWNPLGPLGIPPGERRALVWRETQLTPTLPYRPRTQGEHPLPSVWLTISDVLGLYQREFPVHAEGDPGILAYPRVLPLTGPDLLLTLLAEGPEARGVGVEDASRFAGAREYVPGDPVNRVHWPSTAKRGTLIVKEFAKVRATGVWLHLDTTGKGKMAEVYLEHGSGLAASLLAAAEREGLRVGLSAGSTSLFLGRGEAHMARILSHLAGLEPNDQETPLPEIPAGVNLIVISYQVPLALLEQTLKAHAKAAQVHVIALPEGFYLRPGESGRPLYHSPDSLARLQERRKLLTAEGVRVHLLRGNQSLARLRSR